MRHAWVVIPTLLLTLSTTASSGNWIYLGISNVAGKQLQAFFDRSSRGEKDGIYVLASVKFMAPEEIDSIACAHDDTLARISGRTIADHYYPPYLSALLDTVRWDDRIADVTLRESVVEVYQPPAVVTILYELHCAKRKLLWLQSNWKSGVGAAWVVADAESLEEGGVWDDIVPGSFEEILMKVVCSTR